MSRQLRVPNIAYMPKVTCATCNKPAKDVMRMSDGKTRWIRVRCHGKELKIDFATDPNEVVTLWEEPLK